MMHLSTVVANGDGHNDESLDDGQRKSNGTNNKEGSKHKDYNDDDVPSSTYDDVEVEHQHGKAAALSDKAGSAFFQRRKSTRTSISELSFLDICYTITVPAKKAVSTTKQSENRLIRSLGGMTGGIFSQRLQAGKMEHLKVLQNVSGEAKRGEMLALMGPSGSGKTSLLSVLAQRVPSRCVKGGIFVDGKRLTKAFKRQIGFVFQDDLLLWNLTVRDTLMYAALLRLPQKMPNKKDRVDELLALLGLTHVADSLIGKESWRGISGGERKRVSIGAELTSVSLSLLFCDEPTSGLDSSTALGVVSLLNDLARIQGLVVVCSIHQPRINIYNQFEKILLLDRGRTVYCGRSNGVLPYFNDVVGMQLPPHTNVADWIMDIVTEEGRKARALETSKRKLKHVDDEEDASKEEMKGAVSERNNGVDGGMVDVSLQEEGRAAKEEGGGGRGVEQHGKESLSLADHFQRYLDGLSEGERQTQGIPTCQSVRQAAEASSSKKLSQKWVTSFWYQFTVLMERQGNQSRGEIFNNVNTFQTVAVCVIASAAWWQCSTITDLEGILFFVSIQQAFSALTAVLRVFPSERGLMVRERSTGCYRVGAYFLAKSTSDLAMYILMPAMYATVIYFAVGLRLSAPHFFIFLVIFLTQILVAQSIGMSLSAAIGDISTATSVSYVIIMVTLLLGGFYVSADSLPVGIRWAKYASFLYYGFGAMMVNEFRGRTFPCSAAESGAYNSDNECPIQGTTVLETRGFDDMKIWVNIIVLWAMFLIFRGFTYLALRVGTKPSR